MSKFRFHGDIHGNITKFLDNAHSDKEVRNVQVGDFGFGFVAVPELPNNVSFIRGNHDDPFLAACSKSYIQDGKMEITPNKNKIMFIGGATSIDKHLRIPGKSWWPDEELSIRELSELIDMYEQFQPDIMVTHDCPELISKEMFYGDRKWQFPSRTGQAFDEMWSIHQPKRWIFGHHHVTKQSDIGGCIFQCIGEHIHMDMEF